MKINKKYKKLTINPNKIKISSRMKANITIITSNNKIRIIMKKKMRMNKIIKAMATKITKSLKRIHVLRRDQLSANSSSKKRQKIKMMKGKPKALHSVERTFQDHDQETTIMKLPNQTTDQSKEMKEEDNLKSGEEICQSERI